MMDLPVMALYDSFPRLRAQKTAAGPCLVFVCVSTESIGTEGGLDPMICQCALEDKDKSVGPRCCQLLPLSRIKKFFARKEGKLRHD